jgi:hypothetical protein
MLFLAAKHALHSVISLTQSLTHTPLAYILTSGIQSHTGICRNIQGYSGTTRIQKNTGEYVQEDKRKYSKMKWKMFI